jgi:hypothetical protein
LPASGSALSLPKPDFQPMRSPDGPVPVKSASRTFDICALCAYLWDTMADSTDMFGAAPEPQAGSSDGGSSDGVPSSAELRQGAPGEPVLPVGLQPLFRRPPVPAAPVAPAQPYRVPRKYRPQTFSALIGQEAMVQTLANAIRRDRLAHAFLMTGVRGWARPAPRA